MLINDLRYLFEHTASLTPQLVRNVNLFKGPNAIFPAGPGPFVSIIRSGGNDAEGTHNSLDAPAYEAPGAQVLTRADAYEDAETLALQLFALCWPIRNTTINGTYYRLIKVHGSEPFDLPKDEKGRVRLAFNLDSVKRMSPATS